MSARRFTYLTGPILVLAVVAAAIAIGLSRLDDKGSRPGDSVLVAVAAETTPVPGSGDAADDPAIWVHPTDPSLSLILGTDKDRGLRVYDLDGRVRQEYEKEDLNNVDLRHDFEIDSETTTLVAASCHDEKRVVLFRLDASDRKLVALKRSKIAVGVHSAGVCLYRSPVSKAFYLFVTGDDASISVEQRAGDRTLDDGIVEQWRLYWDPAQRSVEGELVRRLDVGGRVEGCVADDEFSAFYVSEENLGVWHYPAEPDDEGHRILVDSVAPQGRIHNDCEGITIHASSEFPGTGFVIVSSQGSDDFCVYDRAIPHRFIGRFGLSQGPGVDEVTHTDGVDVVSVALGPRFPRGLLVAQDDDNGGDNQNYKLADLGAILAALKQP